MWHWIVKAVGGIHSIGPAELLIHDRGYLISWNRVVRHEWNF